MTSHMKKKKRLDRVFAKLWIIPIVLIVVLQLVYMCIFMMDSQKIQKANFESYVSMTCDSISTNVDQLSRVQNILCSESMHSYILNGDIESQSELLTNVFTCRNLFRNNFYNILFDGDGNALITTKDIENVVIQKVSEIFKSKDISKNVVTFFNIDSADLNNIYICDFKPVINYDRLEVDERTIGVSAVVAKINIAEYAKYFAYNESVGITLADETDTLIITERQWHSDEIIEYALPVLSTGWKVNGIFSINRSVIFKQELFLILFCEAVILLIILLIFNFAYKRYVSRPISIIAEFLKSYAISNHRKEVPKQQTYEFDVIARYINYMTDRNVLLMRQIFKNQQNMYEKELEVQNFRFYALQAQINPHFLYNTLDCIASLAYINDVIPIANATNTLSKILQYSITERIESLVTEETQFIWNYFSILNIRYPGKISLHTNIDDDLQNFAIPRMTLQPILENSVKHNNVNQKKLLILVKGQRTETGMRFVIMDNGRGVSEEKLKEIREALSDCANENTQLNRHIGIANVNKRIKLIYGDEYGITVDSKTGRFFKVVITLPCEDESC